MVLYYEDIASLFSKEEWHMNAFYAAEACKIESQSENAGFFFKEKYVRIIECLWSLRDGESELSLYKNGYTSVNYWTKNIK